MAKNSTKKSDASTNQLLAFLCYLFWPVGLVLLLLDKTEGNLRYHSWNGIGLGLVWWVLGWIAGLLFWMLWPISNLVWLAGLVYAIVLGVKAYNGEKPTIPVVTDLLRKNVKGL